MADGMKLVDLKYARIVKPNDGANETEAMRSDTITGVGRVLLIGWANCQGATGTSNMGLRLRKGIGTDPATFGPTIGETSFTQVTGQQNRTWEIIRADTIDDPTAPVMYRLSVIMLGAGANDGFLDHFTLVVIGLNPELA